MSKLTIPRILQINNGRICGDIAVSRAFGDIRFKTKKNEYVSQLSTNKQEFYTYH